MGKQNRAGNIGEKVGKYLKAHSKDELDGHSDAEEVHHIFPYSWYRDTPYRGIAKEEWNMIALSIKNHKEMHDKTGQKLSSKGKKLMDSHQTEFDAYKARVDNENSQKNM